MTMRSSSFHHKIVITAIRFGITLVILGAVLKLRDNSSVRLWWTFRMLKSDVHSGPHFSAPCPRAEGPHKTKTILLWNTFFEQEDYGIGGLGNIVFNKTNCSNICWITNDKSYLPVASAVVIHAFNMGPSFRNVTLPKRAFEKQIFVFFILESPLRSYTGLLELKNDIYDLFNLTFTFIDDPETDIYVPLGGILKKPLPDGRDVLSLRQIEEKKHSVAWFVSNCNAPSYRMKYVEELSKHIDVHIYGKCGTYTCKFGDYTCFQPIMRDYWFYLSFENSYCEGYATEKTFRTLKSKMVPVVYGGANYTRLLHIKSYIDVRDFNSPETLAKYLHFLRRHSKKYQEYFDWKKFYSVLRERDFKALGFCKLCQILNTKDYTYKTRFDPLNYWNPSRWCLEKDDEMKAVHLL